MGYCQGGLGFRVYGFRVYGLLSGFPLRVIVRFGLRMLACRVAGASNRKADSRAGPRV